MLWDKIALLALLLKEIDGAGDPVHPGRGRQRFTQQSKAPFALVQRHIEFRNTSTAQAALGADGAPSIWLPNDVQPDDIVLDSPPRRSIRGQNSALREENAQLRATQSELRKSIFEMRQQDSQLRKADADLRVEDARLRSALALVSNSVPTAKRHLDLARRVDSGTKKTLTIGIVTLVFSIICFVYVNCFYNDPAAKQRGRESDNDDLREFVDPGTSKRGRSCGWCPCGVCCCCSLQLLFFTFIMMVIAVMATKIMWDNGVIQPILAQVSMYIYVISLFVAFLGVLMWEFWSVFRDLVKYIIGEFRKVKGTLRPWDKDKLGKRGDLFAY